jgi:choline dehydrogenase
MNSKKTYDYIVVGSGSAGSVIASRISEDASLRVLLLEAGPLDNHLYVKMPAALGFPLKDDRFNWLYHSQPESFLAGRRIYQPRGRVLGGSSSINGMIWVRGNPWDFDNWEAQGASNWSYKHVLPYFKRAETFDQGPNPYRGGRGPMRVSTSSATHPLFKAFLDAGAEAGIPLTADLNGYQQEGVHVTQRSISGGLRWSSSRGYLHSQPKRPNLTVLTGVLVTGVETSNKRVVRVKAKDRSETKVFEVDREVILCAGALNTPKLMMISGIGHAHDLRDAGIAVTHDLPGVGRGLKDHVGVGLRYAVAKDVSLANKLTIPGRAVLGLEWMLFKKGIGSRNFWDVGAFLRTRRGLPAPNIQFEFSPLLGNYEPGSLSVEHGFSHFVSVQRPKSSGRVWVDSADPAVAPKFLVNYLQDRDDLEQLFEGIKLVRRVVQQQAWDEFRGGELKPGPQVASDDDLRKWLPTAASTNFHLACSCRIGQDDMAVVDPEGRVHGMDNLRIADASVMPDIVTANTNATVIMLAEKLSDAILGKRLPPEFQPYYDADDYVVN